MPVSVLIITPLAEEREALVSILPELEKHKLKSGWTVEITQIQTQDGPIRIGLLMIGEMGNVAAVPPTLEAIDMMDPSFVIAVGIAGGVRGLVNLGDVIVADQILYVEKGKLTKDRVMPDPVAFNCDKLLLHEARYLASSLSENDSLQGSHFRVRFGSLAAVEKVIANSEYIEDLRSRHRKLVGVEMESYGIAIATEYVKPKPGFIAIRGVSDFADEKKDDNQRDTACQNAARFVIRLITERISSIKRDDEATSPKTLAIQHFSLARVPADTVTQSLDPNISLSQFDLDQSGNALEDQEGIRTALESQEQVAQLYDEFKKNNPGGSVCYFGLSHIPLALDLGYRLTNKRPVRLFEFDRYGTAKSPWIELTPGDCRTDLITSGLPEAVCTDIGDVTVKISISAVIHESQISAISRDCLASVHIGLTEPRRDSVTSMTEIALIGRRFRECLDDIYTKLPNMKNLHLFFAGPCSLAMYLGQLLMSSTDSRIICYNFDNSSKISYNWGLRISADMDPNDRFVPTAL